MRKAVKTDPLKNYFALLSGRKGLRPSSLEAYHNDLQDYLDFLKEKHRCLDDPGIDRVIALFMIHLRNKNLSSGTIARKFSTLRGFYRYLVRRRKISKFPSNLLKSPKLERPIPKVLSIKEIENILEQPYPSDPAGLRDKAILELLYATGIRESELINLELGSVNQKTGSLTIVGKGGIKRIVSIEKHALPALNTYLQKGREELLKQNRESMLFLNHNGKALSRMGVWKIITKYVRLAGIVRAVSPHMFRHSCAIQMLESGASKCAVQETLGLADTSSVRIYAKLTS